MPRYKQAERQDETPSEETGRSYLIVHGAGAPALPEPSWGCQSCCRRNNEGHRRLHTTLPHRERRGVLASRAQL